MPLAAPPGDLPGRATDLVTHIMASGLRAGRRVAAPLLGPAVGSVLRIAPARDRIVLTFDDGPDPRWTPRLLEVMADHGASATFFLLGTAVRRHPDVARALARGGGEIALHGNDHRRITDLPAREFSRELAEGRRTVEQATGTSVRWFRPPYGGQSPLTYALVRRAGLTPVMWTGTFWDWRELPQEERVTKALATRPGGIVLAHDRHAGPADGVDDGPDPRVDRADLLDRVLSAWAQRGVRAVSVGDALAGGASLVRRPWFPRQSPVHRT